MAKLTNLLEDIIKKDYDIFRDETITEESLLFEAAKEPADFIYRVLSNLGFPEQYIKWAALKLAKDFKELLSRRDGLNRNDLKGFAYNDVDISKYENKKLALTAKEEAKNLFAQTWQNRYQDSLISIRDWIIGSNVDEANSFESTIKDIAGGKLEQLKLKDAYIRSKQWHESLGNPAESEGAVQGDIVEDKKIVKVYDEYYWIDNQSNRCSREDGIGCGTDTSADTIFTLKRRKDKQPLVSVSVKFGKFINKYLQAKGRRIINGSIKDNERPEEQLFPYIEDLFLIKDITGYNGSTSHMKQNDFKPEDISNPELKKKFEEAKAKVEDIIKERLGSNDKDVEGVEIEGDSVSITYEASYPSLNRILYTEKYDIEDVLNGTPPENSGYYDISSIWDDMADVDTDRKYSEVEEDYKDYLNIISEKMFGGIYEYEGELYMYGTPEEQRLQLKRHTSTLSDDKRMVYILNSLIGEMIREDYFDTEGSEFKEILERAKSKFENYYITEENILRLWKIRREFDEAAYRTLELYPFEMISDNYNDNIHMDSMRDKGIDLDIGNGSLTLTIPLEQLVTILEENTEESVREAVADYINDEDLSASMYGYEPDMYSEAPYLINNVMREIYNMEKLKTKKPDHKGQLYLQGMKNEAFQRIMDLAGLNG